MARAILRGELYYADLNPVVGSEQGGLRPVLIIQNDAGNRFSPTVIVAAVTSKAAVKPKLPTHHHLSSADGLEKESIVLLEQIRTIDKTRLRDYIGRLDEMTMKGIDHALGISVGLG
ncbi:MAG: type II toxin-antitoxin system PemK/MazF family toxin [Ethanoligenens sp.]